MTFESFYGSAWHHPLLLLVLPLLSLFLIPSGTGFFPGYFRVFVPVAIVDLVLTSSFVKWPGAWASIVPVVFVVLGDLRVFILTERMREARIPFFVRACAWALVVPVAQALAIASFPEFFAEPRHTYLAYELLFLVVAVGYRFVLTHDERSKSEIRTWILRLNVLSIVYYAAWAGADVIILSGADVGFALRVIPNLLYYGGFLLFAWKTAPEEVRNI